MSAGSLRSLVIVLMIVCFDLIFFIFGQDQQSTLLIMCKEAADFVISRLISRKDRFVFEEGKELEARLCEFFCGLGLSQFTTEISFKHSW